MSLYDLIAILAALASLLLPTAAMPAAAEAILDDASAHVSGAIPEGVSGFVSKLLPRWHRSDNTYKAINDISGLAIVYNNCSFPVFVHVCGQGHDNVGPSCSTEESVVAPGGTFEEDYVAFVNDGRSVKIGRGPGMGFPKSIVQLEYTRTADMRVSYDVSAVNGNPFGAHGFTLSASDPACYSTHCSPPGYPCPGLFTAPENGIPYFCAISADVTLTVCG